MVVAVAVAVAAAVVDNRRTLVVAWPSQRVDCYAVTRGELSGLCANAPQLLR